MTLLKRPFTAIGFVLLFTAYMADAQNQVRADSLKQVLESGSLDPEARMKALYWMANYSNAPDDVLNYGEQLLKLARSKDDKEFEVKALFSLGLGHRLMGDLGIALKRQFEAASIALDFPELNALLTEIYSEISTCYTLNGDSENALLYGSKAINILRRTGDSQELALSLLNTGYDYYLIGNYDSAMAYYNESEPIMEEVQLSIGQAYILGNRALVFWKKGNPDRAKADLFKAITMLEPLGDTYGMADYYNQLGNIYLEEGDFEKVIKYATKSYDFSVGEGFKEQARDASYLLFQGYQLANQPALGMDFQGKFHAYKDSIQNIETTQKIADLRTEFEVGRKQAEVDLLLEQKRNDQIIIIAGGVFLLGVIVLVIITYSYLRTKNRLNKKLLEQSNSLMLLNETKDKFFSIISHDLRGSVNTVNALITVCKIYLKEGRTDEMSEMIDKMEHAIGGLMKLLDDLLNWALQQRGHFPYLPEEVDARKVIKNAVDTFQDMAVSKQIDLDLEVSNDFKLYIDRNTASAILRNLINNAIKFTPEGGKVAVQAFAEHERGVGVINISDTGVGMPKEKVDALFNLDEKVSTKGTAGEKGLGLGLQLVSEFVSLNKGRITVESEEGKGTVFSVSLPLA
ncbi:MAG: hypothetical protein Tsb0034_06910 [Ekhidna sp.]